MLHYVLANNEGIESIRFRISVTLTFDQILDFGIPDDTRYNDIYSNLKFLPSGRWSLKSVE